MLLEELEDALLCFEGAAVGHVPQLGFDIAARSLALPSVVHRLESLLHTGHGEEFIL